MSNTANANFTNPPASNRLSNEMTEAEVKKAFRNAYNFFISNQVKDWGEIAQAIGNTDATGLEVNLILAIIEHWEEVQHDGNRESVRAGARVV